MKKLELREHIIKVASELFYANGYNATGINEIISKADIAKATLYSHFKSKDELCISYLNTMNTNFMEGLNTYIESKSESKLQLLGIFDYLRDIYFNSDFNGCWAIKCMAEIGNENTKIKKEIRSQKNNLMAYLRSVINTNLPQNSNAETEKLSNAIYLLYESAISESHLHENDWPIYSARTIAAQLLPKNI